MVPGFRFWQRWGSSSLILVTGGAQGIGAAIVRVCAAEGAKLVIVDRDAKEWREATGTALIRRKLRLRISTSRNRRRCSQSI